MSIKNYKPQFAGQLKDIFKSKASFLRAFGGELQVEDTNSSDKFLNLKIEDTATVIGDYDVSASIDATGADSRMGSINEVVSTDEQVPFDSPVKFNDGIDKVTVNDDYEEIVAKRFALNADGWARYYDTILGQALEAAASLNIEEEKTPEGVNNAFDKASEAFVDSEVNESLNYIAYVKADVFSAIINSNPAALEKGSSVNVDNHTLYKYKGFELVKVPKTRLTADIVFTAENVGVAGLGLSTARVTPHPGFDGVLVQGTAKLGKYIPEVNKKAILKATLTEPVPAG